MSGPVTSTREYVSPDEVLRLLVVTEDNDVTVGFDGCAWHTHGDLLAAVAGVPASVAVDRFLQDLLGNRAVIAVSRIRGEIRDIWVTDAPASERRYLSERESVELRYWNGDRWCADGLAAREVD